MLDREKCVRKLKKVNVTLFACKRQNARILIGNLSVNFVLNVIINLLIHLRGEPLVESLFYGMLLFLMVC
jgi:hypothetical protein